MFIELHLIDAYSRDLGDIVSVNIDRALYITDGAIHFEMNTVFVKESYEEILQLIKFETKCEIEE